MQTFQHITEHDEAPADAVTVGIGEDDDGITASIWWPEATNGHLETDGGLEGPYPVPRALERAEEVRRVFGFSQIVVMVQRADMWRDEWGLLRTDQMTKEPHGDLRDAAPTAGKPMEDDEFLDAAIIQEQERDA